MTRALGSGLTAHLAGSAHSRAKLLRLDLADGTVLAVTDHDRDLTFDLGDGAVTYSASTGISISDVALSTGFGADDLELAGPIGAAVTRAAVLGGRFDAARARLCMVNWAALGDGAIKLLLGRVVQAAVDGGRFRFTVHSEASQFQQSVGRVVAPYCEADFGDARCGYAVAAVAASLVAVTDDRAFQVSFAGTYAADYFNRGTVQFLTGALAGTRKVEVFDWSAIGDVALFMPLAAAPVVGDTLTLRQGCEKTRAACLVYGNVINFRGFPDVPGSDKVLSYPQGGG